MFTFYNWKQALKPLAETEALVELAKTYSIDVGIVKDSQVASRSHGGGTFVLHCRCDKCIEQKRINGTRKWEASIKADKRRQHVLDQKK